MRRLLRFVLLGVLCWCCYAGCTGGAAQKQPTEQEVKKDIEDQGKHAYTPP